MPDPHQSHPIILFDGTCVFCDRTVQLLMRLDRKERLRFAPLQSDAAVALFQRFDVPDSIDSIVLVYQGSARVESAAAIGIARLLGFPWSLAAAVWIIPRPIRDWAYRFVARHRYKIFGTREACRVPEPGQRDRVLETDEDARRVLAGG